MRLRRQAAANPAAEAPTESTGPTVQFGFREHEAIAKALRWLQAAGDTSEEEVERVALLVGMRTEPAKIEAWLVERGRSPAVASALMEVVTLRARYAEAAATLNAGSSAAETVQRLADAGMDRVAAAEVVEELQRQAKKVPAPEEPSRNQAAAATLGAVIVLIGAVLWIGNVTGFLPTVPFAGYVTMTIGGLIALVARQRRQRGGPLIG